MELELTRSSPCGPAEHDEGGSLRKPNQPISSSSPLASLSSVQSCPSVLESTILMKRRSKGYRAYSPTEICELLVDSLESHDGLKSEAAKKGERCLRQQLGLKELSTRQRRQSVRVNQIWCQAE
jgi:hypothetical protein